MLDVVIGRAAPLRVGNNADIIRVPSHVILLRDGYHRQYNRQFTLSLQQTGERGGCRFPSPLTRERGAVVASRTLIKDQMKFIARLTRTLTVLWIHVYISPCSTTVRLHHGLGQSFSGLSLL